MSQPSKLRTGSQLDQHQVAAERAAQTVGPVRTFETPEELLREDAARTKVPPQVAERLAKSLEDQPKPPVSWWRRWLGS